MTDQYYEDAYRSWRSSLHTLMSDASCLALWQERRFGFAHSVGSLLCGPAGDSPGVTGAVLYGVFIPGTGLCYVGQTQEADRRLRDLPVGESHHLANTIPPELWERVVVVQWPALLEKTPAEEQAAAAELGSLICGLALEHMLQLATTPPLNSRRRHRDGDWRPRNQAQSRSRGANHSAALPGLWRLTWEAWSDLSARKVPPNGESVLTTSAGRVVFPATAHESPQH
ncbi:hypothetical protein [Streptomyces sp. NPDC088261]|uniref:hypothetical protein n=1 Tax=Streptomyces sp. NPDC088261 TaxID=3365851 RepID=UPI0038151263